MSCTPKLFTDIPTGTIIQYRSLAQLDRWSSPILDVGLILHGIRSNEKDCDGNRMYEVTIISEYGEIEVFTFGYDSPYNTNKREKSWAIL